MHKFLLYYTSDSERRVLLETETISEQTAIDIYEQCRDGLGPADTGRLVLFKDGVAIRIFQAPGTLDNRFA